MYEKEKKFILFVIFFTQNRLTISRSLDKTFLCFIFYNTSNQDMTDEQLHNNFVHNISTHQAILHKICNLYAHNKADRQDLLQEMLLQLWRAYPHFRGQAKISTWMYRIALNTAISSFRKQKRQIKTQDFQVNEAILNKFTDNISVEEDEKLAQMYVAIAKLKDLEKAIVMLYLEDYSYEKIATILGISANHIGVKLHRIKLKLKKMVEQKNRK